MFAWHGSAIIQRVPGPVQLTRPRRPRYGELLTQYERGAGVSAERGPAAPQEEYRGNRNVAGGAARGGRQPPLPPPPLLSALARGQAAPRGHRRLGARALPLH